MTYAHKNIDIRPLPFVEAEKSQPKLETVSVDADKPADLPVSVIRQKPLSIESTKLLRKLQNTFRNAPPLKAVTVSAIKKETLRTQ